MTAYMVVVVAQTKIGFLTGGRGEKFRGLPEGLRRKKRMPELLWPSTRARKMCVIFCPLDMKGLIGAATVMGSLMYGAGHCWNGMINMHLRVMINFFACLIIWMFRLALWRSGVTPLWP